MIEMIDGLLCCPCGDKGHFSRVSHSQDGTKLRCNRCRCESIVTMDELRELKKVFFTQLHIINRTEKEENRMRMRPWLIGRVMQGVFGYWQRQNIKMRLKRTMPKPRNVAKAKGG